MGQKKQVAHTNEFHCCEKVFNKAEFIEHATTAHGYVKGTRARRSLVAALDGEDFYSNTFLLEIPCGDKTIKVQQVSAGPRRE